MYGQSVEIIDHPDARSWNEKDRMKILLAESLISSFLLFYDKPLKDANEIALVVEKRSRT